MPAGGERQSPDPRAQDAEVRSQRALIARKTQVHSRSTVIRQEAQANGGRAVGSRETQVRQTFAYGPETQVAGAIE